MKGIKLLLLSMLISLSALSQTTPWTSTPAVSWQTRTLTGEKQIRALFGTSLISFMDSLHNFAKINGINQFTNTNLWAVGNTQGGYSASGFYSLYLDPSTLGYALIQGNGSGGTNLTLIHRPDGNPADAFNRLQFNNSSVNITTPNGHGLEYSSAKGAFNPTDSSFVIKKYVDSSAIANALTFNNGLTKTGGNVQLGGQFSVVDLSSTSGGGQFSLRTASSDGLQSGSVNAFQNQTTIGHGIFTSGFSDGWTSNSTFGDRAAAIGVYHLDDGAAASIRFNNPATPLSTPSILVTDDVQNRGLEGSKHFTSKDGNSYAQISDVPTTGKLDSTYITNNPSLLKYNYIGGNVNTMFSASVSGWDQGFGEFGNTIYYNGKIYQFYTGFIPPETETNVNIGLQVSSDGGKTWVKGGPLGDGKIISRATEDPFCVFYNGVAYLFAEDKQDVPFRNIRMWTSDITDLVTWTDRGDILDIGTAGSWEETDVSSPTVVVKDGIFKLLYEGRGGPNGSTQGGAIGLATAPVSVTPTFTKFSGNPILIGQQLANTPGFTVGNRGVVGWATAVVPDAIVQNNGKYYTTFHGSEQLFPNTTNFVAGIAVSDTSMKNMRDNLDSWLKTSKATDYNGKGVNLVLDSGEYKVYYVDTTLKVVRRGQLTNQASADFRDKPIYFGGAFMRYLPTDTASTNAAMFRNPTTRQLVTRSLYASDVKNIWGPVFTNSDAGYVADFNNVVNTQPGYPRYLMLGTATNAPPNSSGSFFYVWNVELGATKDGTHNILQYADSYGNSGNKGFKRTRVGGTWSSWFEMIDNSSSQTLASKILTSPRLNTTSTVGQVWTADGSNNGSGAWLTPSNIFNGIIFNNNQVSANTSDQRPYDYSTSGTGSGIFAAAGNRVMQGRPNDALSIIFMTGATPTERVRISNAGLTVANLSAQGGIWYSSTTAGLASQSAAITGLVKGNGTGAPTVATANTDYLPVASPAMTGTPTAPTATAGTNTTQLATTAFVQASVTGAEIKPYRSITSATTIAATDYTINATSGTFSQPLPTTALTSGQILNIHNAGGGIITITATSIDGQTSIQLQQGDNLQVQYTGVSGTYIIL